jgi:hypothetical protein
MQITKEMIKIGPAPERINVRDGVNMVLALNKESLYAKDGSNAYIPRWQVSNAAYYNSNLEDFEGWIDLEDIPLPDWVDYP